MPVLAFEDVHKSFGKTRALRGVTLEVRPGEVFGLLGPNGAGKTTLIRIALDIIRADRGQVRLFDRPLDRADLDRVAYLPEERGLYKRQRVLDVLVYFGKLKGLTARDARARAHAVLEQVGLAHVATDRVERLSKGMSQKVQIAATMLADPDLSILDEPFSGLDPVNVQLVKRLIVERRDRGKTTVLSTHLMNQVEALCDRVGLVSRGELVVYGETRDVRRAHSQPEVRVRLETGELPRLPSVDRVDDEPDGSHVVRLADGEEPSAYLGRLVDAGARIDHFELVLAPLERVFVENRRTRSEGRGRGVIHIRTKKVRAIAFFELMSAIRRPSYLVMTFGLPLFFGLLAGIPAAIQGELVAREVTREVPFGAVDEADVLHLDRGVTELDTVLLYILPSVDDARRELLDGNIEGYFVIPPDYVGEGRVRVVQLAGGPPFDVGGATAERALRQLLVQRLLAERVPTEIAERVRNPLELERREIGANGGERRVQNRGVETVARLVVPVVLAMLLLMALMTTSGYLVQAIAVEKENKVVEVLLSSADPDEILMGKLVGLGGAGLIQFAVWSAMVVGSALWLAGLLEELDVVLPWRAIAVAPAFFVLGYLFVGSLMLATGSLGNTSAESQKLTLVWGLLTLLPILLLTVLMQEPNGWVAEALTWIPFTTPLTVVLRIALDPAAVPWWEVAGAFATLGLWTWLSIRLGARLFRVGVLLSGSWPGLREIMKQARL